MSNPLRGATVLPMALLQSNGTWAFIANILGTCLYFRGKSAVIRWITTKVLCCYKPVPKIFAIQVHWIELNISLIWWRSSKLVERSLPTQRRTAKLWPVTCNGVESWRGGLWPGERSLSSRTSFCIVLNKFSLIRWYRDVDPHSSVCDGEM